MQSEMDELLPLFTFQVTGSFKRAPSFTAEAISSGKMEQISLSNYEG